MALIGSLDACDPYLFLFRPIVLVSYFIWAYNFFSDPRRIVWFNFWSKYWSLVCAYWTRPRPLSSKHRVVFHCDGFHNSLPPDATGLHHLWSIYRTFNSQDIRIKAWTCILKSWTGLTWLPMTCLGSTAFTRWHQSHQLNDYLQSMLVMEPEESDHDEYRTPDNSLSRRAVGNVLRPGIPCIMH